MKTECAPDGKSWMLLKCSGIKISLHRFSDESPPYTQTERGDEWHDHRWPWAVSVGLWGQYQEERPGEKTYVWRAPWIRIWRGAHWHRRVPKYDVERHEAKVLAKVQRIKMYKALLEQWEYAKEPDVRYTRDLRS